MTQKTFESRTVKPGLLNLTETDRKRLEENGLTRNHKPAAQCQRANGDGRAVQAVITRIGDEAFEVFFGQFHGCLRAIKKPA